MRNAYRILLGKHEGKKPHKLKNIIKMDLKDMGCQVVEWIFLAQNRVL
jgi:hypothetical protein